MTDKPTFYRRIGRIEGELTVKRRNVIGGYSQVVSAALVTVRSSGSLVGGLLELRLDLHAHRRAAGRRGAHRAEVGTEHHLYHLARSR